MAIELTEEEVTERVENLPQLAEEFRIAYMYGNFATQSKLATRISTTLRLVENLTREALYNDAVSEDVEE